jgi:hypothetical protein
MDSDRFGIAGIAGATQGKRALAVAEDEEVGELVPQMLGLHRTGQQDQEGGRQEAAHAKLRIEWR